MSRDSWRMGVARARRSRHGWWASIAPSLSAAAARKFSGPRAAARSCARAARSRAFALRDPARARHRDARGRSRRTRVAPAAPIRPQSCANGARAGPRFSRRSKPNRAVAEDLPSSPAPHARRALGSTSAPGDPMTHATNSPVLATPIERRHLLSASALLLAAPRLRARRTNTLSWQEFLHAAPLEVEELARGTSPAEHDAYLFALASLAARIERVPGGKLSAFGGLEPEVLFGMLHRGKPFFVVEWRLMPGAVLPGHCHPGASVCTLA